MMADKSRNDQPPPPLLLMPASQGLTLSPTGGSSLLMPVPQTEASLLGPEEEGEADSFVGQAPTQQSPYSFFQSPATASVSDPFANVCQPDLRATPPRATPPRHTPTPPQANVTQGTPQANFHPGVVPVSQAVPPGVPPVVSSGGQPFQPLNTPTPPRDSTPNQYRMSGGLRYAQPPPGTYANSEAQFGAPPPSYSGGPPVGPPPSTISAPPMIPVTTGVPSRPPVCAPPPTFPVGPPVGPPTFPSSPPGPVQTSFTPVVHHWFYCKNVELRQLWQPFSITDSIKLEDAFRSGNVDQILSVEGGRYDVDIRQRLRRSVYWEENDTKVRRCSWFFKHEGDHRYVPYEEDFAERLEEEYKVALTTNSWHKRIELETGETIIMHNPGVVVHFRSQPDDWGTTQGDAERPKVVKRGIDDFDNIEDGEPSQIDHLVFVVHGIGSTCDLRFRNIVECVDDFRVISLQMLQSHFRASQDEGRIGRVEFLPVRWHAALHGDATGIDRRLKGITLQSIGKLRHFTNDTLLDILFYASPAYCQNIIDTVGSEINRLYKLFQSRNPSFRGNSSVAGHSLGSLVCFDLLTHQSDLADGQPETSGDCQPSSQSNTPSRENTPSQEDTPSEVAPEEEEKEEKEEEVAMTISTLLTKLSLTDFTETFQKEQIDMESLKMCEESDLKDMGIPLGPRKKLLGYLKLQKTKQKRKKEEAERRARQETERQMREEAQKLAREAAQQELSTRASLDPLLRQASNTSVNYVVGGVGTGLPLVHYPQLAFHPTHFFALGSPIAMFQTVRGVEMLGEDFRLPTCFNFFNIFHPFDPVAYRMEPLIVNQFPPKPVLMPHHKGRKRLHLELKESLTRMGADIKQRIIDSVKVTWKTINDFALAHRTGPQELTDQDVSSAISQMTTDEDDKVETGSIASSIQDEEIPIGQLNQGRRIDYVLQEKPIESFNDYLFALGSHACYWESEDTVLLILKEIYAMMGVAPQKPGQPARLVVGPPPRTPYMPGPIGSAPRPTGGPASLPMGHVMPQTTLPMGMPPQGMAPPPQGFGQPPPRGVAPPPHRMAPPPQGFGQPPPQGMALPPQGFGQLPPHGVAPPPHCMAPPPQTQDTGLPPGVIPPNSGPPPLTGFVRK